MILDEKALGMADKVFPWDDTEAEARISHYTADKEANVYGLANLLFRNYDQLCRALRDLGWTVDLPVYISNEIAGTTWIGTIIRGDRRLRMVVHSYPRGLDTALVINVDEAK